MTDEWQDEGNWVEAASPPTEELAGLLADAAQKKLVIGSAREEPKNLKVDFEQVKTKILRAIEASGIGSLKAHGWTFYKKDETSVKTPKTIEEKQELFEFLRERGIFDEMVSVNSKTLNTLYKNLSEEAADQGILEFVMPGVGAPTTYTTLEMRRSK